VNRIITHNEKENTITLTPGMGDNEECVMEVVDFYNIMSDFSYSQMDTPEFEAFVLHYFVEKDKLIAPTVH